MTNSIDSLVSPPTQYLQRSLPANRERHSSVSLEVLMLIPFIILLLQGTFHPVISEWLAAESNYLSSILPYRLYPLDLLAFPLIIFLGILSINSQMGETTARKGKLLAVWISFCFFSFAFLIGRLATVYEIIPGIHLTDLLILPIIFCLFAIWQELQSSGIRSNRFLLLLLWWAAFFIGVVVGFMNNNPGLMGDIRIFLLRPLLAVGAFYIGLRLDFPRFFRWLVAISLFFAVLISIDSLAFFIGFSWPLTSYISGFYGGIGLLFPYVWLLAQVLGGKSSVSIWLALALIAFAMLTTLAKPLVAAFSIVTLLAILFTTIGKGNKKVYRYFLFFGLIIMIGAVLYWLLFVEGSGSSYIATRYLKEGLAVRDLSGGRFTIWQIGWQRWLENPFIGQGSGYLLSGEIVEIGSGSISLRKSIEAHNIIIQLLYQLGALGVFLISFAILTWIFMVMRTLKNTLEKKSDVFSYRTAVTIGTAILLMSLYGAYLGNSLTAFIFWIALGFEAALSVREVNSDGSDY